MKTEVKTALIFVAVIAVAIGTISTIFSSFDNINTADTQEKIDKTSFKKAPDLVGIAHYLNTTPEELISVMENKVILYDIWTYSCINCVRTLPYITAWDDKYSDQGLLVIGIHSPEFEFEKNPKNVQMAIAKHGINYPVVLDNDMETWKAFDNRYWPRKYIADHEGYIRFDHIGEGAYKETEEVIQLLLAERSETTGKTLEKKNFVKLSEFEHAPIRTPELYFGFSFAEGRNQLGNEEGFSKNKVVTYQLPEQFREHYFYVEGMWKNNNDGMMLVSDSGKIVLNFKAKQVNIVASNEAVLKITYDGNLMSSEIRGDDVLPDGTVNISEPRLYNLIESAQEGLHEIVIKIENPGFEVFTFTFG
ncbi:MAG: redoxin domain-containing protein [Candidatus Nitrosopelagicus sp.]|nr:redoxin domain-containing protein [Candidatus Nitrosopelagicus sp.]